MNEVVVYSDGACVPNPGIGAWCCIICFNNKEIVITGIEKYTTNNRMEISGIAECLLQLSRKNIKNIKIVSDSKYAEYGLKWDKKRLNKSNLPNKDLWENIHNIINSNDLKISFEWVKGHNNHPYNERCDELAMQLILNSKFI